MSLVEVPPFDFLTEDSSPYQGFGPLLPKADVIENFSQVVAQSRARIIEMFGASIPIDRDGVALLEGLVARIWADGWDPNTSDINLFVRDFGSVFMSIVQAVAGGELVFRSKSDLSHASLWWPKQRREVFPFHKMYRRFIDKNGESLVFFVDGLQRKLGS